MKIGLYIGDGTGNGVGGAELMMAYLGAAWGRDHAVDLIHHRPLLTHERFAAFSTDDYSCVNIRCVPRDPEPIAARDPLRRYRAAHDWHEALSDRYDLFVNCGHWLPPFCHARAGALLVLFPSYVLPCDAPEMRQLPGWKRLRHRAYCEFEWRRRMASYQHTIAISQFVQRWALRRWRIACDVIYPPVDVDFGDEPKENLIVSVGRFNLRAHKKQFELMATFGEMKQEGFGSWSYTSVGGLNTTADNHDYFDAVRRLGLGCCGRAEANLPRVAVKELLQRARIFWHGMGLNEDTEAYPGRAEHFGIATVEAMAAGCVPVVIDKGGQREIVEHGLTGFKWKTVDELKQYTRLLAEQPALWAQMSSAARARARAFNRDRFVRELSSTCGVPVDDSSVGLCGADARATALGSPRQPGDGRTTWSTARSS